MQVFARSFRLTRLSFSLRWLVALFIFGNSLTSWSQTTVSASITAYDQLLQKTTSDDDLVTLGDMQIRAAVIRSWRDKLTTKKTKSASPSLAAPAGLVKWPGGIVYYTFASDITTAHQRAFRDAAGEWTTFANVQFVPRTTQTNYMLVQNATFSGGQSAVGMVGPAQLFLIGSWNRGTLVHEIGHTLGLIHEHQRSDRDTYVNILTANINGGATNGNFTLIPDSLNNGPYDFYSVMHYIRNAQSLNPDTLNTIEPKPAYSAYLNIYGQQYDRPLSTGDRAGIALMYGPGPVQTSVVTNTKDSGPGSLRAALCYAFDHPGTTITFNIPTTDPGYAGNVWTISPTDQLFAPGNNTIIDGSSQPGNTNVSGPEIVLSGINMTQPEFYTTGLKIIGQGITVRDLIIIRFSAEGIRITGSAATGNTVSGCYIGTDKIGVAPLPNAYSGITISGGASGNLIGGYTLAARNIIGGNTTQGIFLTDTGTKGNTIAGNYIGLRATGAGAVANGYSGIGIFGGASNNTIGGTAAGARNVIAGNTQQGVAIGDSTTTGNTIAGNFIGTIGSGNGPQPNGWSGVNLFGGTTNNTIGGTTVAAANVISGNANYGIAISDPGTSGNVIAANYIGTNSNGTAARGNTWSGIEIYGGASNNTIGSLTAAGRNFISGNNLRGIGISGATTTGNNIINNYIGVSAFGNVAIPNQGPGILLYGGTKNNTVGNSSGAGRNAISGNTAQGIVIADPGTTGNTIINNCIGTRPNGATSMPNAWSGIDIFNGASGNFIGIPSKGNLISGNGNYGISLSGTGTSGNLIRFNVIGLNSAIPATALPNAYSGVVLFGGASGNTIGGNTSAETNIISGNSSRGIDLFDATTLGNSILRNAIYGNAGIPLNLVGGTEDFYGVNTNDAGDADTGPNNLQNYPVITKATTSPTVTNIAGSLQSNPGASYLIEFFTDTTADASSHGGCRNHYAFYRVTTNASGVANFNINYTTRIAVGTIVSAIAIANSGDTSEYAQNITVSSAP